jgi:hypothetical protein
LAVEEAYLRSKTGVNGFLKFQYSILSYNPIILATMVFMIGGAPLGMRVKKDVSLFDPPALLPGTKPHKGLTRLIRAYLFNNLLS